MQIFVNEGPFLYYFFDDMNSILFCGNNIDGIECNII